MIRMKHPVLKKNLLDLGEAQFVALGVADRAALQKNVGQEP
jgi:hypothetical protein